MPKQKTKKALAKRIKVTKKKKLLRNRCGRRHLLSGKNKKRKRRLRSKAKASSSQKALIKKSLPYKF